MSKLTFEAALRSTLANSRLACILEGERPTSCWLEAMQEDIQDVEAIIDKLCEDLTMLTGRPIRRFSKLRANMPHPSGADPMWFIQMAFNQLNKQISYFIKSIMNEIRSEPRYSTLTYPISKIRWNKYGASVQLPDANGKIKNIALYDPEQKQPRELIQPAHIQKYLKICEKTHFDYQPYILADSMDCKILALRLGCDWHDLAIATWEPEPILNLQKFISLIIAVCFLGMIVGLWLSCCVNIWWISCLLTILSGGVGIIGGLLTTLLFALLYKPLKL